MRHSATRILFAYWDLLRGERTAPERGEIQPGAIRHVLADMFVLSTEPGQVASFRLAGTRLCALMGGELKGRAFASLWPTALEAEIERLVDTVLDDAAGVVGGVNGTTERGASLTLELLLLPLRHHGKTHARLLGALSPAVIPPWIGLEPITALSTLSLRVIWPSGRLFAGAQVPGVERRRHLVIHTGGRA